MPKAHPRLFFYGVMNIHHLILCLNNMKMTCIFLFIDKNRINSKLKE